MSVHAISPGPRLEALGVASALTLPVSTGSYLPNGWQRAPPGELRRLFGPGLVYPAGKPVLSRTASGGYVMLC